MMKHILLITSLLLVQTNLLAQKNVVIDRYGAIIRGDSTRKEIALVFTGDEFAEGGETILATLTKHKIKAAFFLTGNFYSNYQNKKLITDLIKEGHYLGPHSDKHLLYADWNKRDSLLIPQHTFTLDMLNNFERMTPFGIQRSEVQLFIPPFEWYNSKIVQWSKSLNLTLINFTPGTRSTADYTYPEMESKYVASDVIYESILNREAKYKNGLNGFILLTHIGTDPRRTDKFYNKLDQLIAELKKKGYKFIRVDSFL